MRRVILAGLASFCSIGSISAASAAPAPRAIAAGDGYVAMGSSFASGLGVAERLNGQTTCGRSTESYAQQLARLRGLKLTDNTCSGATTVSILQGRQASAPQLDGLTADTRLVTITIGGNDVRFTADMGRTFCLNGPTPAPAEAGGGACAGPSTPFDLEAAFTTLGANLRAIVAEVRKRSPQARLIFVDYVTLVPPKGVTCAAFPATPAQADDLRSRAERLAALTAQVAREGGAEVVQASAMSQGHEICAAQPWAYGVVAKQNPADFGPAGGHPNLLAHTQIAKALDAMLR